MLPSLQSRIDTTFFWIDKFLSLLTDTKLHIEVGKFDIAKMINPEISGIEHQQRPCLGYYDVRYFFARDEYACQLCGCKNKILETHHIIHRYNGLTNRADNLITVCIGCHTPENNKESEKLYE